jgi:L-fuculose-phosphate aldolase
MASADLKNKNVITGRDAEEVVKSGAKEVVLASDAVLTSTAKDLLGAAGIKIHKSGQAGSAAAGGAEAVFQSARNLGSLSPEALYRSPEAMTVREEIAAVGHKLWQRGYVDGNGGNISCRMTDRYVLCSPTLMSKSDLTADDICLVDMEGRQLAGKRVRTSEVLLHLAIFKTVPQARACVHAHPPHATAYAITGKVPPNNIIPEQEVFAGMVAFTDYETPGTPGVAEKVVSVAKDHNTILLGNHGVICWGESPLRAEWSVEVVDTYCLTLIMASLLGVPITRIPDSKAPDLLAIKKKLNMPDPRFAVGECALSDMPEKPGGITVCPPHCKGGVGGGCGVHGTSACPGNCGKAGGGSLAGTDKGLEALIQKITDEVMGAMK